MLTEAVMALVNFQFQRPGLLWVIPILLFLLLLLLAKDFVKVDPKERYQRRRAKIWMFVIRALILTLILIALAQPYGETTKETKGNPRVVILDDQSGSMGFLDTSFVDGLSEALSKSVTTRIRKIGSNLSSEVGSSILQNLEPGTNILLISDANPTKGVALDDVAFYATTQNVTISAINLTPVKEEFGVTIIGPGKVVADSDATYTIKVTGTDPTKQVHLTASIDGVSALDTRVYPGETTFTRQFTKGNHKLEAHLEIQDAYKENNVYYKSIAVLPKPKVLLVTKKSSPLELLLRQLYQVEKRNSIPQDLSPYYAIILNDVPVENVRNTQALHNFLIDEEGDFYGGGLVVFGGLNSYDRGGYSGSSIENLLPVTVGKGERKKGESTLIFILDMSGSTGGGKQGFINKQQYDDYIANGGKVQYSGAALGEKWQSAYYIEEGTTTADVIKAQAVAAIEQLRLENNVAVIAFGIPQSGAANSPGEFIENSVAVIEPLDKLYNNRKDILEKIPRIVPGGPTSADRAIEGAINMLKNKKGDRHIILLTNGRYSAGLGAMSPMKQKILTLASNAHKQLGINFMTIGVGVKESSEFPLKVDEGFLKKLATAGDGTYDRGTKLSSLLIKWGDPKAKEYGQEFVLVPLSLTHFITRGIEPSVMLNGYNEVVPKDTAELLLAADSGQPALTTWRYGNGRVAAWSVFAGNNLGQLLNKENSLLLARTVNWAIGNPQRKESYYVEIPDVRINERGTVKVRSSTPIQSDTLDFSKEGDFFTASFQPTEVGYGTILGEPYAVNRPNEYDNIGMNPALDQLIETTGGKLFKPSEKDAIIDFIKEASRRTTVEEQGLALPFIVTAALLLLLEILIRRITERRRKR